MRSREERDVFGEVELEIRESLIPAVVEVFQCWTQ
jgi:hypothetical protein